MDDSTPIGPVGYASLSDVKEKRCKKSTKAIRTIFTGSKIPNNVPFLFAADA